MATPMTEVVLNEVTASERPPSSTPAPPPKPVDVPATANAWWLLGPGVSFPSDERGVRSTTRPAKSVWAAAALGLGTDEGAALAAALLDEKDWRHKYSGYLVKLAELQCISMPEQCIASCKAGLDAAAETFEWRRGSVTTTLKNAMTDAEYDAPSGKGLRSAVVRGSSSTSDEQSKTHANLFGPEVTKRAQGWATSGCAEGDVATALQDLDTNCEKWVKGSALKDTLFILLGGTSELCPLVPLLNVGANVACIARKSARLREAADIASKSTGGTLYMPLAPADGADDSQSTVFFENGTPLDDTTYSLAGANLTTQTPEIRTWLLELARSNEWTRVVIGSYAYADGEAHVRTSLASDAITHSLCTALGVDKTAVAFLSSPGTAFPIPEQCWTDAKFRHAQAEETESSLFHWRKVVGFLGWGGGYVPSCREPVQRVTHVSTISSGKQSDNNRDTSKISKESVYVHDGHLILQGPNYALAKTLQNWRTVCASADGHCVSAHMAPGSRTKSMQHVKAVAIALEGQKHFKPLRPFDVSETRETMTALLLRDLGVWRGERENGENKAANDHPIPPHPMDVFGVFAVHGGTWRCPWSVDSIGRASMVAGTLWG